MMDSSLCKKFLHNFNLFACQRYLRVVNLPFGYDRICPVSSLKEGFLNRTKSHNSPLVYFFIFSALIISAAILLTTGTTTEFPNCLYAALGLTGSLKDSG